MQSPGGAPWTTLGLPCSMLARDGAIYVYDDWGASALARSTDNSLFTYHDVDGDLTAGAPGAPLAAPHTGGALLHDGAGGLLLVGGRAGSGATTGVIERTGLDAAGRPTGFSVAGALPTPRHGMAGVTVGNRVFLVGGADTNGGAPVAEVLAYTTAP